MSKLKVPYETRAVNPALDPEGGYSMAICDQQIIEDDTVYEDAIKEDTLPVSVTLLKLCAHSVLRITAKKVSEDCRPRRIGDYVKFAAFIRGKVPTPYSAFDSATCTTAVLATPLKGITKKVNLDKVALVNVRTGDRVIIERIVYEGCQSQEEIATIMRNKCILVTGLNLQWIGDVDTCELRWTDADGNEHSAFIEPTESGVTSMKFAWPAVLDSVAAGTVVGMHFTTHAGNPEGDAQKNDKDVTLIEGEILPTVTKVATAGKDGIVKGQAFEAVGTNLGFNFATDHASVEWMDGDTPRQAALVPTSATAEKIAFSACELFDDLEAGTELTFTFELGGKGVEKKSVILAE